MICINRRCQKEIEDGFAFCPYCGKSQTPAPKLRGKRPNGSGSVYKLSDGKRSRPWVVARNNKPLSYHATKAEAYIALDKLAGKPISEKVNFTFAQVYNEWAPEHARDITKHGMEGYAAAYKWCAPLHNKKFRMLRTADLQAVIDSITEAGRQKATADKTRQLISQLYKWAMREDICDRNYAEFIKMPEQETKEKVIFTDAQIEALEAHNSEPARIVLMLIYTGVRIGELFSATLENYHGTHYVTGSKTDAGRNRIVPIPAVAQPHFQHFASKAKEKLLDGYAGNRTARMFRAREFHQLMKDLGISGVTPHSTRHTFISHAIAAGVPPESLQKIVGHANYTTTVDKYNHTDADKLITAANQIW